MDITYNMIAEANKTLKPMDIKGKNYIEVNQRIKAFRMLYPTGYIVTEIIGLEDGVITMKATVGYYDEAGNPHALATGTAQEKESSSFINRSSFVENCETSCIGRAIGMVGIGIDTSVASFEEVSNAIANQSASKEDLDYIRQNCTPQQVEKLLTRYHASKLEEISQGDITKIILKLNEKFTKEQEIKL